MQNPQFDTFFFVIEMVNTRRTARKRNAKNETAEDIPEKNTRQNKRAKLTTDHRDQEAESPKKNKGKMKATAVEEEKDEEEFVPTETFKENNTDQDLDEDSDEDSFDWEAIEIPQQDQLLENKEDKPVYKDVEIVMEAPRPVLKYEITNNVLIFKHSLFIV